MSPSVRPSKKDNNSAAAAGDERTIDSNNSKHNIQQPMMWFLLDVERMDWIGLFRILIHVDVAEDSIQKIWQIDYGPYFYYSNLCR